MPGLRSCPNQKTLAFARTGSHNEAMKAFFLFMIPLVSVCEAASVPSKPVPAPRVMAVHGKVASPDANGQLIRAGQFLTDGQVSRSERKQEIRF